MEALDIGWIPGIAGRDLRRPIVPRCYGAKTSCSRRNGNLQLLRLFPSTIGKNTRVSKNFSMFRIGEAPFCQLLPRTSGKFSNYLGTSYTKRLLCGTHTWRLSPLAVGKDQEYDLALQENSAKCELSSEIAPSHHSPQSASELKQRRSTLIKLGSSFDEGYEGEILHREMLSRLTAAEATAPRNNQNWVALISDPDHEPLRSAASSDMSGNLLAVEDENWLLPLKGGPSRQTCKLKLERTIDHRLKEPRRSMLNRSLPPSFFHRQSRQRAARMNVMVSYGMSYMLERREYTLDGLHESDVDVLDQNGILGLRSSSFYSRKAGVFTRSPDYKMSSRETASVKMGMLTRERVGRSASYSGAFRYGRVRDPTSKLSLGSGGSFRYRSRMPVPTQNRTGRRLWSRAHSGVESAGNLFKDILAIVGLVAFVVYGTYAFAVNQKYLKCELWFRKPPSESVAASRSAQATKNRTRPTTADVNQGKVVEMTDENFVDTIQSRPTFVLFYASWCPYCQKLDPTWKEVGNILINKGYNIQLARLNAEKYPSTAANFKVVKYPTLIFFRGGIAVENYLGPRTVDSLVEFVDETLNKPS